MASGPITSWQINGKTMETVKDYFLGLQNHCMVMTAAMKLKDAPWKESYDKPRQCIKKQRHHFADKAMIFPVIMYRCESWTIKKAEH